MKSIKQVSRETDLHSDLIRHYVVNNFKSEKHNGKIWIDNDTESKLHYLLHITGKLEYVTLESKINKKK